MLVIMVPICVVSNYVQAMHLVENVDLVNIKKGFENRVRGPA